MAESSKVIIGANVSAANASTFRRVGITFTREPRRVDLSEVTPAQLEVLLSSSKAELRVEPIEGTDAERDDLEKRRGSTSGEKRKPNPDAKAYGVTAVRAEFRRVGMIFPLHKEIIVRADQLTPAQRDFLLESSPNDLRIRELSGDEVPTVPIPADERRRGERERKG